MIVNDDALGNPARKEELANALRVIADEVLSKNDDSQSAAQMAMMHQSLCDNMAMMQKAVIAALQQLPSYISQNFSALPEAIKALADRAAIPPQSMPVEMKLNVENQESKAVADAIVKLSQAIEKMGKQSSQDQKPLLKKDAPRQWVFEIDRDRQGLTKTVTATAK